MSTMLSKSTNNQGMSMAQGLHANADEIDLAALAHQLWVHKWLLLLTTIMGLTLGVFFAKRQPVQYQTSALLQVDAKSGGAGVAGGVAQQLIGGAGAGDSAATQMALIQSPFVLEPVVESLGLNISVLQRPTLLMERLFPWAHKKELKISRFDVPESAVNHRFKLEVDKPGHVRLFSDDGDVILSGAMGQVLTSQDLQYRLQTQEASLSQGTQFIVSKRSNTSAIKSLSHALKVEEMTGKGRMGQGTGVLELSLKGGKKNDVLRTLNAIAETARIKDGAKKSEEASQTLEFLHHQLPITKQLLEKAENALNQYRAKSGKIDIKLQTQFLLDQLANLDKQLGELRIKTIEMKQQFKETHPVWIAQEAQVQAIKFERAQLEETLKKLPASDQVAVNLMRDVDVKQSLYLLLLNKIQELEVVKAGTISGVRVLSHAALPDRPLPSKAKAMVLGGMMLGFMLGVMVIFVRKLLSPRVDDPHWSERQFNLPNVAIVPYCKEQAQNTLSYESQESTTLPLLAQHQPKNLAIEALRSLRTSLQVSLACANNNIIGILGVAPHVGKTFVSTNLAHLLAAAGKRVLLIDTDLRKGALHKTFNFPASPGLADILGKKEPLEQALRSTSNPNLTVLPRGAYPKDPAELLTSERFKGLVKAFSQQYDIVLFDTAPVLLVTDAVIVGAFCATNYLVVGAGAHSPSEIEMTLKRLDNAGVHVTGSIFNFHKSEMKGGYYGKYYNYSYYYHDEEAVDG